MSGHHRNSLNAKPVFELMTASARERFWSKVDKRDEGECWNWTAACHHSGYGQFAGPKRSWLAASRVSLAIALGRDLSPGMIACHTCDNKRCVNPRHLYEGTTQQNSDDALARGRVYRWGDRRVGAGNPSVKLTEAQARYVRDNPNGLRRSQLCAELGISYNTVSRIQRGFAWRTLSA